MTYADFAQRLRLPADGTDTKLAFDPRYISYYEDVQKALALTPEEQDLYRRTGLVSVDHDRRYNMANAYLEIYQHDLPVLITADSMLHALHRSFDNILIELETTRLAPALSKLLETTHERLRVEAATAHDSGLRDSVRDVDLYVSVARNLLAGSDAPEPPPWMEPQTPDCRDPALAHSPDCKNFAATRILNGNLKVASALGQDDAVRTILERIAGQQVDTRFPLFGAPRTVDWSQFKPRGHYANRPELSRYFLAMMWIARADTGFNLSGPEANNEPGPSVLRQRRDAGMLVGLVQRAGQLGALAEMNHLLEFVVGESDNATAAHIATALNRAGLHHLADLAPDSAVENMMRELAKLGGGGQVIRSQILDSPGGRVPEVRLPDLFQLFGQRFVLDSYVLTRVVFDSILFQGERKERTLPSGLDVMAAFGNDEAAALLAPELEHFQYSANLLAARTLIQEQPRALWNTTAYNVWLDALAQLAHPPVDGELPQVMRSRAWRRKELQTQLASWAELRHDTILYAKQSYTMHALCEYPAAYVEPYPAFFARLAFFAQETGSRLAAAKLDSASLAVFFKTFAETMHKLEHLAAKELAAEPFDAEEQKFVKDTIQLTVTNRGCGGASRLYTGWYPKLFYNAAADSWEPTVADVHSDPNRGILEVGVGDANLVVAAIDNRGDKMAYVGPIYSYYEFVSDQRLRDDEWRAKIGTPQLPPRPEWTRAFQPPVVHKSPIPPPPRPTPAPAARPAPVRDDADLTDLSKSAFVSGMNAIRPQIDLCYAVYQVPGVVMVNVVIRPEGFVSSASVSGRFAGTPTGKCVEKAVKTAQFPRSKGLTTPYPFQLK